MSIKDYLQKKKDPEGYLQKRAHEILRELEDLLSQITERTSHEIESFTETKAKIDLDIREFNEKLSAKETDIINTVTSQKLLAVNSMTDFADEIRKIKGHVDILTDEFLLDGRKILTEVSEIRDKIKAKSENLLDREEKTLADIERRFSELAEIKVKEVIPDTGEQIAKKLNETKESVSMGVIVGLLDEIKSIKRELTKRSAKGGGGGMGNVQHEQFSTSSATTSINLSYGVAGNGYALWVYYNGQFLARGVGYTVSGSTVSFNFTLDDNSAIDVTYMRG